MVAIDIRVDGVSIADHCLFAQCSFTSVADGNPGEATVRIDNSDRSLSVDDLRGGRELTLHVDGTRVWDGWIFGVARSWPFEVEDTTDVDAAPRFWTLHGYDRNLIWGKRVAYDLANPSSRKGFKIWPEDTTDKVALEYALDHYVDVDDLDLAYDIREIASPSPWESLTLGYVGCPLGVIFEDCSEMTGGVYWVGPERTLHYRSDRIVTAPFVLSDTPSSSQVGYRDMEARLDFTEAATQALVWGAGKGSAEPVFARYTNDTYRDLYGLWQWGDEFIGAWKQETVDRRARTYVNGSSSHRRGHGQPVPSVLCTVFEPGLKAGHVVDFRSDVYGYQEDLPVRRVTMTFPTPSEVKYELDLSLKIDTPWSAPDPWWRKGGQETPYTERLLPEGPPLIGGGGDADAEALLIDHFDVEVDTAPTPAYWLEGPVTTIHGEVGAEVSTSEPEIPSGSADDTIMAFLFTKQLPWQNGGGATYAGAPGWGSVDLKQISTSGNGWVQTFIAPGNSAPPFFEIQQVGPEFGRKSIWVWNIYLVRNATQAEYNTVFSVASHNMIDWSGAGMYIQYTMQDSVVPTDISASPANMVDIQHWDSGLPWRTAFEWRLATQYFPTSVADPDPATVGRGNPLFYSTKSFRWVSAAPVFTPPILETPGPEVTGAPWEGGNDYHDTYSQPVSTMSAADSIVSPNAGAPRFRLQLYDNERWVIPFVDEINGPQPPQELGDIVDPDYIPGLMTYEWSGFSTEWWSGGVLDDAPDILIKWRFTGTQAEMASASELQFAFELYSVPDDRDPDNVWATGVFFDVGGNLVSNIQLDVSPFWFGPTTWPPLEGDDGDLITPYESYLGDPVGLLAGTWYYTRVKVAAPLYSYDFYPYVDGGLGVDELGLNLAMMKTWPVDSAEPMSGTSGTFYYYWPALLFPPGDQPGTVEDGWDIAMPMAWAKVFDVNDPEDYYIDFAPNQFEIFSPSVLYEVDAIWRYGEGAGTGSNISEIPVYDNTENEQASIYITTYPYKAGSLVIWYQGIRLRPNVDYIELDPADGTFRILGDRDISSSLTVQYLRAGSTPTTGGSGGTGGVTGGAVYRPAPQLQYGWGTRLDGYNCNMACSAMALDRHTQGQYTAFQGTPRNTPPNHRGFQSDQVGGTDIFDAATAWTNGWGKSMFPLGTMTWGAFAGYINEGRGAILQGRYGDLPASKRFSSSFTGGHSIYVNEQFSNGNFWGIDPLYRYPVVYTAAELQDYAVGYISTGLVSAGFTRVTT